MMMMQQQPGMMPMQQQNAVMPMQQQPGMMPMQQQPPMMPSPSGTGTMPMLITNDEKLQCHFSGCSYLANSICMWPNAICSNKSKHGCRKRFCYIHRYEKVHVIPRKHGQLTFIYMCCVECGKQLEKDILKLKSCACKIVCCFIVSMILAIVLGQVILRIALHTDL